MMVVRHVHFLQKCHIVNVSAQRYPAQHRHNAKICIVTSSHCATVRAAHSLHMFSATGLVPSFCRAVRPYKLCWPFGWQPSMHIKQMLHCFTTLARLTF